MSHIPRPALSRRQLVLLSLAGSSMVGLRARRRLGLPPALTTAWLFAAPVAVASAFRRSWRRDMAVWGVQMWAYKNAFELPEDQGERLERRAHIDYPIAIDSRVTGGQPPSLALQRRLRVPRRLTRLDKLLGVFYLTWEAEPHVALAWIRHRHRERFASAAGRLALTFDLTLIGYWLVPSAPPWWASVKEGRMGGEVERVMPQVLSWLKREPNPTAADPEVGANPFAAMPSDHFASAAMTALLLTEVNPAAGAFGWAYALTLGFALVYLGEHYVADLVAGLALALTVNRARSRAEWLADRILGLGSDGRF